MLSLKPVRKVYVWRSQSGRLAPRMPFWHWLLLDDVWIKYAIGLMLVLILGYFAQSSMVGLVLVGVYGLAAIVLRLPSENTFKIALLGLVALPVLTVADLSDLAGLYAQYVFLLLCFGTAGALAEQWRGKKSSFGPDWNVRKVDGDRESGSN